MSVVAGRLQVMNEVAHSGVRIPFTGRRTAQVYEQMLLDHVSTSSSMKQAVLYLGQHGGDPYQRFGRARTATLRSDPLPAGGPVFTWYPDDRVLASAIARARGTMLAILSSDRPDAAGWAAAVRAHNLLTGEATPGVDTESVELFGDLVEAGYRGGHDTRDGYIMSKARPAMTELLARGHNTDFIVTYCLAMGLTDKHARDLRTLHPGSTLRRSRGTV